MDVRFPNWRTWRANGKTTFAAQFREVWDGAVKSCGEEYVRVCKERDDAESRAAELERERDEAQGAYEHRVKLHEALIVELTAASQRAEWQPPDTAPKSGPCNDVALLVRNREKQEFAVVGHWAYGGGEDQPRFGPAWFRRAGNGFVEINEKVIGWSPLPDDASARTLDKEEKKP